MDDTAVAPPATGPSPGASDPPCPACAAGNGMDMTPVYAIGRIDARFPRLAVEKEFAQATGRADAAGLTDREAFHAVLSSRANRYLLKKICWVMTIQGLETYLLLPGDHADLDLLVETIRPRPGPLDLDIVIGSRGRVASPSMCNGLMLPTVTFDQIYSFDRDSLIGAIPPAQAGQELAPAAEQVLDLILQMTDNAGATDEHRALNYLAVRYPAFYAAAAEKFGQNMSLTAVDVRPSTLSGTRHILEVIVSFTHRATDVTEKMFTRVDVTEEFPFLVTKMSPYYHR